MGDPSVSRDWVQTLPRESARWVQGGLISEEQRTAILGLYPADAAGQRDRTVLILTVLGSVLLGAGVILFFAANWPRIPAEVKLGAILAAVVGAYGAGYWLQFVRTDFPRLGQALIFLGSLFYGAGVWLVAQIYHLDAHYPNGFLMWAVGVLPVAWAVSSPLLLYLSTILLGIWSVTEQGSFASYNVLFPLILLGGVLPLARRLGTALAEAAVPAGLWLWFVMNLPAHAGTNGSYGGLTVARTMLLFGVATVLVGLVREVRSTSADSRPYLSVGAVLTLAGAYVLTFHVYGEQAQVAPSLFSGSAYLVGGVSVMLAAAVAGAVLYVRQTGAARGVMVGALALPVLGALVANLLPDTVRMVAFNLLLFAGTIGLTVAGIRRRSELLVNLGLLAFIIHVVTRYFDLFFAAMDRSLFFVLGGVLLLGGGWALERNRRRWLKGGGGHDR